MHTGTFRTADRLTLYTMDAPVVGAKAAVYIVHGIGEHIGRYTHVTQYLNGHGYAVFGHDHRGHGRSEGERVFFDSFDTPVRDLKVRVDDVRAGHPGLPLFMYGHSMGSLITTLYLEKYQNDVRGWISSGSPLWVDQTVPALVRLIMRGMARIAPRLPSLPVKPETISRDPAVVAAYKADPYVSKENVKLGMAAAFTDAIQRAKDGLHSITVPTLIVYGTADVLTPPKGSELLYDGIRSADKTRLPFDGLSHEVHNEPEQGDVLAAVSDWLDKRVS
jgi:acylglycerol lipase